MEILERIILIGKSGKGLTCSKISLPYSKLKKMGFDTKNKDAFIIFTEDSIIIKKKPENFLKIIEEKPLRLENGVLLVNRDYNREKDIFIDGINEKTLISTNKKYKPFYIEDKIIGYEEIL